METGSHGQDPCGQAGTSCSEGQDKGNQQGLVGRHRHHRQENDSMPALANAGMNPKALQYIMGHANITMTLNYYAYATCDSAKAEMERLAA